MGAASAGLTGAGSRLTWIDVAKALGIVLVFHGHLMEHFGDLVGSIAICQRRWIYSFHMPLFFLLSGLVYKERNLGLAGFAWRQVRSRLIPVWAFNLLSMLIYLAGHLATAPNASAARGLLAAIGDYAIRFARQTLEGRPQFNILLWFVVCLCVVETWQYLLARRLRSSKALGLSIAFFVALTLLTTYAREALVELYGDYIHWWHLSAAVSAMVFYQLGILVSRFGWFTRSRPAALHCILAAAALAITLASFNRNEVPGSQFVLVKDAFYGNVAWFFLTSLAGCLLIISLGRLLAFSRILTYVGQVTMPLMCLNGMMDAFLNPPLARAVIGRLSGSAPTGLISAGILCTLLSVVACLPVCWLLNRYTPFLLGRAASVRPVPGGISGAPVRT